MKALMISDHTIHEMGCAAALQKKGVEVSFLNIGSIYSKTIDNENLKNVIIDIGKVQIQFNSIEMPTFGKGIMEIGRAVPNFLRNADFDLIISTPQVPWYAAATIRRAHEIPLLIRVQMLRAAKLVDHLRMGRWHEMLLFGPSVFHNLLQVKLSNSVISLDNVTKKFMKSMMASESSLIYPTYAILGNREKSETEAIMKTRIRNFLKNDDYIFSITIASRGGAARIFDIYILKILLRIALENPNVKVIVLGTNDLEARKILNLSELPYNLILLGKIFSDDIVRELYIGARLIICPVMSRSISNRLLEALFFAKPVLTNSIAGLLHPEICNNKNAIISNYYTSYGRIVKEALRNDALLNNISKGAGQLYRDHFSSDICGNAMIKEIRQIIT